MVTHLHREDEVRGGRKGGWEGERQGGREGGRKGGREGGRKGGRDTELARGEIHGLPEHIVGLE